MKAKLNLDMQKVEYARKLARSVALDTQDFIDKHTTVATERAVCRLLGIDGVDEVGVPLPNVVVNYLLEEGLLGSGAARFIAGTGLSPQEVAEMIGRGDGIAGRARNDENGDGQARIIEIAKASVAKIAAKRAKRAEKAHQTDKPYLYVIVATGN
ncbi:MAG: lysine 5,6-aminomutase subunit alpha, partial [Defluviitaleaceae bacterium]|nr:lysine 5,6-aminomutase subunit alpha [Defluviitaleaceae bacterium]